MVSLSRFVAAASSVALVASSSAVFARSSATLRLESDAPQTEYRVHAGKKRDAIWLECFAPCALSVPSGKVRIEAKAPGIPSGDTTAFVVSDSLVVTRAGDSTAKTIGLTAGIVGTAAVGVGLVGALLSDCFSMEGDACRTQRAAQDAKDQKNAFLVVAAVGALVGALGWIVFAGSGTSVQIEEMHRHRPRVVSFGVAPTSGGGATFGALGIF